MKKRMRFTLEILITLFLSLSIIGCWDRNELDKLAIVTGVGLDKAEDSGKIQLTAQIVKAGELKAPKKEGGESGKVYWNLKSSGDTVFTAVRELTHKSSRKVYFPHIQVLLFSKAAAQEGVKKYLDFFARDHEIRLQMWILVAKNRVDEVLEAKPNLEKIPAVEIASLMKDQNATSETSTVNLQQFLSSLMSKTTAPVASLVEATGVGEDKTIQVSGTAVFKRDKLVGELNKKETRGFLWTQGKVNGGIIDVVSPGGQGKVGLEITRASGKMTPVIRAGRICIKINIKEEGNLGDQTGPENLALPPKITSLEKLKAAAIRGEVLAALKKARKLNADIFGFGEAIHQKYPKLWKDVVRRWDDVFPNMDVEVTVQAKLRRIGLIAKPVNP